MSQFQANNIPYDDDKTWDLICSGFTKGVFQCESKLVQHWLKRIAPRNIWELSAVIAIVRPGPLKSGFADEYVQYRTGEKAFESFGHPIIDAVFSTTDHVMIYQEQIMGLGSRLAWQHLPEKERLVKVDSLRKGVGKKDQSKLVAIGKEFVEGCKTNGLDEALAAKLFDIIKNCGRYVFNLSHSILYAHAAYKTAYLKCHYPFQFWTVYLTYAKFKKKDKWKEIENLVTEGKVFGIEVKGPNINSHNEHFKIEDEDGSKYIRFGLSHMKFFGGDTMTLVETLPPINDWRQVVELSLTTKFGKKLRSQSAEALVITGAFSDTKVSRNSLLNVISCLGRLSPKEREWVIGNLHKVPDIKELPKLVMECAETVSMSKRKETVRSEAQVLKIDEYDNPVWIEQEEKKYLGVAISATAIDAKEHEATDTLSQCQGEFPLWTTKQLAVIIDKVIITQTKTGKNPGQRMAVISIHDATGAIEKVPVFPDTFAASEDALMEKNIIVVTLKMGKRGWFVESLYQL
jgi:DNA polymerase III subunit alpha